MSIINDPSNLYRPNHSEPTDWSSPTAPDQSKPAVPGLVDSADTCRPSSALRRNARDGVFCDLFSQQDYLVDLYHDLHPEDIEAGPDDLEAVTLERIVTSGSYNDLGFLARDRLMVLVEAQSTWSPNITTRLLLYVSETYRRMVQKRRHALYGSRLIELPTPEFYVVYTGSRSVPEVASFRNDVLKGSDSSGLELKAKVITSSEGVIGEYVEFCEVFQEIMALDISPEEKARLVIERCLERGILVRYFQERREEAGDIMFTLFDQEEITRLYHEELKEEAQAEGMAKGLVEGREKGRAEGREKGLAEGRAEGLAEGLAEGRAAGLAAGLAEGRAEGRAEGLIESVRAIMSNMGADPEKAMELLNIPAEEQKNLLKLI